MTFKKSPKVHILVEFVLALTIYSIVAIFFLGSALKSNGQLVIGQGESDVWKHLWGDWWMYQELANGKFPIWTDLQNFPDGGRLYIIDPLNAFCAAVLQTVIGLVNAFNVTQCFQLIAASLSAWGLARWITKDHRAALVAGVIYGFCPFMLSSGIASGIDETSNLAWLPLSLWGLLLCLNGERPKLAIALGGIGLALAALGTWYYGMTAGLFWIIALAWTAISGRNPVAHANKTNWLYPLLAGMLSALLALPFVILFTQSLKGESSLLGRVNITERQEKHHLEFMYRTFDFKNNAVLSGYFRPGKDQLSVASDVDCRLKTVYIGIIALLLAALGCWKDKRNAYFWVLSALLLGMLSLGPYLAVTSKIALAKPWSPLYLFAYYAVPGFRMVAICDRLSIGVQISVAILAALGLSKLLPKGILGLVVALGLCSTVVAELIVLSPIPWPLPCSNSSIPTVYQHLATIPERQGLICLPLNRINHNLQPGEYYYWQTAHGKPLPNTLTTRFSNEMMSNRLIGTLYLCADDYFETPPETSVLVPGLKELRERNFRWIVINTNLADDKNNKLLHQVLTPLAGQPQQYGNDYLYDLASPTAQKWLDAGQTPKRVNAIDRNQ